MTAYHDRLPESLRPEPPVEIRRGILAVIQNTAGHRQVRGQAAGKYVLTWQSQLPALFRAPGAGALTDDNFSPAGAERQPAGQRVGVVR